MSSLPWQSLKENSDDQVTVPILTFFNRMGGVGTTSLAYHLVWMLSEIGHTALVFDLDPQANEKKK